MITREQLQEAIRHEADVCIHLHGKIPQDGFDYRPTESQRTTLDLLRYIGTCLTAPLASMIADDWNEYDRREEAIAEMTAEEFPDVMERQSAEFAELLATISDDDLRDRIVQAPGVGRVPLGFAIMRTSYAWIVAYRHELFIRAKLAGNSTINTANNWSGVDWNPKKEQIEESEEA